MQLFCSHSSLSVRPKITLIPTQPQHLTSTLQIRTRLHQRFPIKIAPRDKQIFYSLPLMQAYFFLAPTSFIDGGGGGGGGSGGGGSSSSNLFNISSGPWVLPSYTARRSARYVTASATVNNHQNNHYAVLGVSPAASASDIKKAYRLLAKKYHPDVSKSSTSDEAFKRIRLAYDVLSNETTRDRYDQSLQYQEDTDRPLGGRWDDNVEYVDGIKFYRWAKVRQKMQTEQYWQQYYAREQNFYEESDGDSEEEILDEERGSFLEVLRSAFLTLFLMQTIGIRLSLMFSCLMALLDRKLDSGYKIGYLLAWVLGGRGGILLTMFLSFAIWVCGKGSSSIVALVVLAMWIGSNIARFAPLPQGALLTLLYMSIKLQSDLK